MDYETDQPGYYEDKFAKEMWKARCKQDEYVKWQLIWFATCLFVMLVIAWVGKELPITKETQNFCAGLLFVALALNFIVLYLKIE